MQQYRNQNCDFSFNIESKSIVWLKSYIVTALVLTRYIVICHKMFTGTFEHLFIVLCSTLSFSTTRRIETAGSLEALSTSFRFGSVWLESVKMRMHLKSVAALSYWCYCS